MSFKLNNNIDIPLIGFSTWYLTGQSAKESVLNALECGYRLIDTAAALIGTPGLLINKDTYPPILCLSALKHKDNKLMLCFKAYGHHLEFWCMSQMLTPGIVQVSEQWSGGLTLFALVG